MTLIGLYMTIPHKIAAFTIQILSIHSRNDQSRDIHTVNMCTYTASANIYAYKAFALSSDFEILFFKCQLELNVFLGGIFLHLSMNIFQSSEKNFKLKIFSKQCFWKAFLQSSEKAKLKMRALSNFNLPGNFIFHSVNYLRAQ